MQDADLFMELAAIAGVFVGFGALIAVRSGGASDAFEVAWMRGVVSLGLLAVFAALAPVIISRYDVAEHEMWALCSGFYLVTFAALFVILSLTPEGRSVEDPIPMSMKVVRVVLWALSIVVIVAGPIAIVLGIAPVKEAALYFTLVALALFWSGICLLMLVFTGRRSTSA